MLPCSRNSSSLVAPQFARMRISQRRSIGKSPIERPDATISSCNALPLAAGAGSSSNASVPLCFGRFTNNVARACAQRNNISERKLSGGNQPLPQNSPDEKNSSNSRAEADCGSVAAATTSTQAASSSADSSDAPEASEAGEVASNPSL